MISVAVFFFFHGMFAKEEYKTLKVNLAHAEGELKNLTEKNDTLLNEIVLLGGRDKNIDKAFLTEKLREQALLREDEIMIIDDQEPKAEN